MKLIKRYQNRKLYDTSCSQYIDLADIEQATLKGEKIKVIDLKSEQDITRDIQAKVLARVYYEQGKPKAFDYLNLL